MKKISVLLFVLLIFISSNASAAKWEWVASDDNRSFYIDASNISIERNQWNKNAFIMNVWSKIVYLNPDEQGTKVLLHHLRYKVNGNYSNLSNVEWSLKSYTLNDSDVGVIVTGSSSYDTWESVIPDSICEMIYRKVCKFAIRPRSTTIRR